MALNVLKIKPIRTNLKPEIMCKSNVSNCESTCLFKSRAQAKRVYKISSITGINTSSKLAHNQEIGVYTSVFYGAPGRNSGYETCPDATDACRGACLYASGLVKVETYAGKNTIKKCRVNRTKLFFENQSFFMAWVIAELKAAQAKAKRDGMEYSVRLNGTTDIAWETVDAQDGMNIFELFPDVQFYDYTKAFDRMSLKISNYHLTFSYTGEGDNVRQSLELLAAGKNVAVVFDTKRGHKLPTSLAGIDVIDGDVTDYRPADKSGCWVGLRLKMQASNKRNDIAIASDFVINVANL